jgi:hypothetical protein
LDSWHKLTPIGKPIISAFPRQVHPGAANRNQDELVAWFQFWDSKKQGQTEKNKTWADNWLILMVMNG